MNDQLNQIFGNVDLSINRPEPGKIASGFPTISYPSIESISQQQQLSSNQIRTASFKGEQNINGTILVKDDRGTTRVLAGYDKDGFGAGHDYGIKVSQENYDVTDAVDANLVMSSAFNLFKVVAILNHTETNVADGVSQQINVAHGLTFAPAYLAYGSSTYDTAFGTQVTRAKLGPALSSLGADLYVVGSTPTHIVLALYNSTGNPVPVTSLTIKIYCFVETAS